MRVFMERLKQFIKKEISGWRTIEVCWLLFCLASILGLSLFLKDSAAGIASSLTGTLYIILAGKGKISCYFFGIFNTILYGLVSYQNRLFGEVMLNWGWYLPMMMVGIFFWKRNLDKDSTIIKTALSLKGKAVCCICCAAGIALYAQVLKHLNDPQPVVDSLTTVLSVAAMILTVKRCSDQWIMWIIVNCASVWMWYREYVSGSGSAAVLLMWIIALANGIIFYIKWHVDMKKCQTE